MEGHRTIRWQGAALGAVLGAVLGATLGTALGAALCAILGTVLGAVLGAALGAALLLLSPGAHGPGSCRRGHCPGALGEPKGCVG